MKKCWHMMSTVCLLSLSRKMELRYAVTVTGCTINISVNKCPACVNVNMMNARIVAIKLVAVCHTTFLTVHQTGDCKHILFHPATQR